MLYKITQLNAKQTLPTSGLFCKDATHYVINNCISSLHSGLAITELCMARDGGKLENFVYSDCLTFMDLLCVS